MKRFEIPELSDEARWADIKYYNNPEDSKAFIPMQFNLSSSIDNALFTLTRASQTVFDHAREFGESKSFSEEELNNGFSNAELKKIQKQSADDAVNKVIFSVATNLQGVTTGIFDATFTPDVPVTTLIAEILRSLKKAFSLKDTLKILDADKLAPNSVNKNTVEMSRHLRDAFGEITGVVSVIFDEFTNEEFLAEQDFATKAAIKVAAGIVRKIYDFAKTSHDNFDLAIKAYEKKQEAGTKAGVATAESTTQEKPPERDLAELARKMTYPEIKDRIAVLKDKIQKERDELKKLKQTTTDFETLSTQLQQNLNVGSKENAEKLMEILAKTNPYQALKLTCDHLKAQYDALNPQKVYRTEIGEKLAQKTKALRKKSGAVLNPQKQENITKAYNNLWSAVLTQVNGTINLNNKKIDAFNKSMKDDQEELMYLESIKAPHIFTKAFWVNLWNKYFARSPKVKQVTVEAKEEAEALEKEVAQDDSLEGESFQPAAFSKPVGSKDAPVSVELAQPATKEGEEELSEDSTAEKLQSKKK